MVKKTLPQQRQSFDKFKEIDFWWPQLIVHKDVVQSMGPDCAILLGVLSEYWGKSKGPFWIDPLLLQEETGLTARRLLKCKKLLKEAGWIRTKRGFPNKKEYYSVKIGSTKL